MSERATPGSWVDNEDQLPGFFGAERAEPRGKIEPRIWEMIDHFLERNRGGHERLIPVLHMVQESLGYIPVALQEFVADRLGLSPIQVYGVISFYHFFTTTPRGKHEFKVCMGTACFVRHAQRLLETIRDVLGINVGQVTEDREFSVEQVRCLGACGLAPAMMLDDEVRGNLTAKDLRTLVRRLQSKAQRDRELAAKEDPDD